MRRWTLEDQGQFREFPRDEPVWYDCPILDIPNTMVRMIENMPDNIVAVSIIYEPVYMKNYHAAFQACRKRDIEVVTVYWDTLERSHDPGEQQALFDLRWKADMRAIKAWQSATGHELVWPDHADLCVWLLGEVRRLCVRISEIPEAGDILRKEANLLGLGQIEE